MAILLLSLPAFTQMINEWDFVLGAKGGYVRSTMQGVWSSIKPGTEFSGVTINFAEELWRNDFAVGGFVQFWPRWGAQFTTTIEGSYTKLGGIVNLDVQDSVFAPTPYNNKYEFFYDYFHVNVLLNYHPALEPGKKANEQSWASGIRISVGVQKVFPVSKKQVIEFSSTNPTFSGPEIQDVEDNLNDIFEGESYWGVIGRGGYQVFFDKYNFGLSLECEAMFGLDDAILTKPTDNPPYVDAKVESIVIPAVSFGFMYRIIKSDR